MNVEWTLKQFYHGIKDLVPFLDIFIRGRTNLLHNLLNRSNLRQHASEGTDLFHPNNHLKKHIHIFKRQLSPTVDGELSSNLQQNRKSWKSEPARIIRKLWEIHSSQTYYNSWRPTARRGHVYLIWLCQCLSGHSRGDSGLIRKLNDSKKKLITFKISASSSQRYQSSSAQMVSSSHNRLRLRSATSACTQHSHTALCEVIPGNLPDVEPWWCHESTTLYLLDDVLLHASEWEWIR